MTDLLFSHLLIIFLCIPVLLRPFSGTISQYQNKRDTFSIIPLIAVGICALSILAFSLEISNLTLLAFCLLLFFLNLNRFISFSTHMQRDYFNAFFKTFSLILLIILAGITTLLIVFRPAPIQQIQADQTKTLYYGNSSRGFFTRKTLFDPVTAEKTECLPASYTGDEAKLQTVLYIPDLFCSTEDALEQLLLLAQFGYRVVSFDFYTSDINYLHPFFDAAVFRSVSQRLMYVSNPDYFETNKQRLEENKERETAAALSILQSEDLCPIVIIAEGFTVQGAQRLLERYPQAVSSVFTVKEKSALETSPVPGMAQLSKTKPLELFLFGLSKNKERILSLQAGDISPDVKKDSVIPSNAAQRAHSFFSQEAQ